MQGADSAKAALYLRSSKDRSDVSPAAQRRALEDLASSRSLSVAKIYEDAVESGSTEDRPAFGDLARDIRDPRRGWSFLLVYDTSRLARRRHIAQAIKHLAKKSGVTILYATLPADLDPISELLLESVFEAMDEAHSLMSKQKGLAGMAENVRQGWRAGGRAPFGYVLKPIETGAVREGKPVTKTKLELAAEAPAIRDFLRARAQGLSRLEARKMAGLQMSPTSLIGIEWNALAYAGHTVWNRHRESGSGTKRWPRSHWQVTRNTHPALISDREAEAILAQLENSNVGQAMRQAIASRSGFLLSGLLFSPDGRMWVGSGSRYRLRRQDGAPGRTVSAAAVDEAVTGQVREMLASDAYLEQLVTAARKHVAATTPGADLEIQIGRLAREREKAAERALGESGDVYARLVEQRGRQIEALRRELAAIQREAAAGDEVRRLTVSDLRELFRDQEPAKAIRTLVERVVLTPSLQWQIRLRAQGRPRGWLSVASPGGFEPPLPP